MGNITGEAYAFLDHGGTPGELVGSLEEGRDKSNLQRDLSFRVLAGNQLPKNIAKMATVTDVYGTVPISRFEDLPKTPKKASDLGYIIMATAPEVSDGGSSVPLKQGEANRITAEMLGEALSNVGESEYEAGHSNCLRAKVFYKAGNGQARVLH